MRKARRITFLMALTILSFLLAASYAWSAMPLPGSRQDWIYNAVDSPVLNDDPAHAHPIGVGTCAGGGNGFDIQIGLNRMSGPADIYFAIAAPALSDHIYPLTARGALQPLSAVGLQPWMKAVWGPTDASLFGTIAFGQLPAGTYFLGLLVTPAGQPDTHVLWTTSVTRSDPGAYAGLYCVTLSVQPQWKMRISPSGEGVTFTLSGNNLFLQGQGTVWGNTIKMTGKMPSGQESFTFALAFSDAGQRFAGHWEMKPGDRNHRGVDPGR
jgi:hypothetical protein